MAIWIWTDLDGLTENYHDGGGAIVTARYWSDAVKLLRTAVPRLQQTDEELAKPITLHAGQDSGPDQVIIFPNAGCC